MVLDDSIYATLVHANALQSGNIRTNREMSEDEKINNVPDNISNSSSVVTGSNQRFLVKSCASTAKDLNYGSESDGEIYFDCTDETPVITVDKYTWLTKDSYANENELVFYERQDSKLKGDDEISEQDHNSDSDFLYVDEESNTELIEEQNEDINSSDIFCLEPTHTEHIYDEVQRSKGTEAEKYDTISDLQNIEKRHGSVGYVLDLTDTLEKENLAKYYIDTKANNEIHSKDSKGNTDDKKEVFDMQEKEQGSDLIDVDAKEAVDDYPKEKESENATDVNQENEHDINCKNAVSENQGKDEENDVKKAADKIRRKADNIFGKRRENTEEEVKIVGEKAVCVILVDIQEKDDDYDGLWVVGEILREANAIVGKGEDVKISGNDDEIDCESGAAKEKEYNNENVGKMSAGGMKAVEDETYDNKAVRETQNVEIREKHGDIDSIKAVWEVVTSIDEETTGRIQRLTGDIDVEEVDSEIVNVIVDGEEVDSENIEENAAFNGKHAVVEILETDDDIYNKKAVEAIGNKKDGFVLKKAMDQAGEGNDKNKKVSNEHNDRKDDFSFSNKKIKGTLEMTSLRRICLKGNNFHHPEACNKRPCQKTWFTTGIWKLLEALLILICGIPYARGANNAVPSKVTWSLQTNPVVFGSNATLCCIMQSPDTTHMAWVRDPNAMIVATGNNPSNPMKYSASVEPKGNITYYWLTIINIDMTDVNVNYKCESGFIFLEKKLELKEESFVMKPSSKETATNITRENGMITFLLKIRNMYPRPDCFFSSKKEKINGNVSLEENGKLYNVKMAFGISEDMCEDNITAYCVLGMEIVSIDLPSSNNSWTRRCLKDRHGDNSVLIVTVVIIITLVFIVIIISLLVKKYFARKVSHAFKLVLKSEQRVFVDG